MPVTEVVAVIAFARFARIFAEIFKIWSCHIGHVIMVARAGIGAFLVASPGWPIAILKLNCSTAVIGVIARGEYCCVGKAVEQRCSFFVIARPADSNITGSNQDGRFRCWREGSCDL